jgi:hypothetical protein
MVEPNTDSCSLVESHTTFFLDYIDQILKATWAYFWRVKPTKGSGCFLSFGLGFSLPYE